ncbi:MAG: YdcF family protein [Pyrinomonadaceae bacterium]
MEKLRANKFKIFVVFLAIIGAWVFLAQFVAEFLIVNEPLKKADALYILGGSSAYQERSFKAAKEYRNGVAGKIFVVDDGGHSGWSKIEQTNLKYSELTRRTLIRQKVNPEDIEVIKPYGSGTIYEAFEFKGFAKSENIKSVLLVTSEFHSRRAIWTFQKHVPNVTFGVVSPEEGDTSHISRFWWLSRKQTKDVLGEYVKFAYYWVFY